MSVAARHGKERFTDILCYFAGDEDPRSSLTNLKPYIYSEASRGRTISSRIEVIATVSPFRQQLPRHNRSTQAALRSGKRGRYVLQESQPIWPLHLLPEDSPSPTIDRSQSGISFSESRDACSAFGNEPMMNSVDRSPSFAAKVASALEPVMPFLPAEIQQSLEVEEVGNGLVQVNIFGPSGKCVQLEIDASKEIVINRAELITAGWGGRKRAVSLELLTSSRYQLANYIKEVVTQLKY
jgi:hypothetical protein